MKEMGGNAIRTSQNVPTPELLEFADEMGLLIFAEVFDMWDGTGDFPADRCCNHRAIPTDADLHRYRAENLAQADALLFGRVTYEMMEAAWRPPGTGVSPDWMAD